MNHHDAALDELLDDMAGRLTIGRGQACDLRSVLSMLCDCT